MTELYRVGDHQPQNLYRGDRYIGVMFDPADTKMIAELLNRYMAVISTPVRTISLEPDELAKFLEAMPYPEPDEPETFRDGEGDVWTWNSATGRYSLNGPGNTIRTLKYIKERYGTWGEPETFRDGQGDVWRWDPAAGGYNLNGGGLERWTLGQIKAEYGTWSEPETFRDGEGDVWRWDRAAGGYNLDRDGLKRWTLDEIKERYGTWSEDAD